MKNIVKGIFVFFICLKPCLAISLDGCHEGVDFQKVQKMSTNKLMINVLAGSVYDQWSSEAKHKITYCISDTFSREQKQIVIDAMEEATRDWMSAGDLQFIYLSEYDSECNEKNENVVFDVRPTTSQLFLARAFFPSSTRPSRNILVSTSSFSFDQTAINGFLRHELGHVLGFRREHISSQSSGRCKEDNSFHPLTSYDQYSVMHYPQCGGLNDIKNLVLTDLDREGVSLIYGSAFSE